MSAAVRRPAHTHAALRETDRVTDSADAARSPAGDLLPAIARAYGLTTPLHAQRLTGGYANDVFLLDGERSLVLHVKHPPVDLQSLAWEHHLLQLLSRRLSEIPMPLTTLDRRTFLLHEKRPVWLTTYVAGHTADATDRRAVAAALGRLHAVQLNVPPRPRHPRLNDLPIPPIRQLPPEFDRWLPLIAHARAEMLELITHNATTRSLTVGVTHNDIFPGNVLIQDGQVTALIDWEEADIDWLVWDVASSLWPFCSTAGGELDTTAMEDFLDSYRAAGGRMPTAEDDLIIPLLRAKRILEVLRAPSDRNPCWDYQLTNLQAYQALS
jgi:Ser/Thr protein kinase RdoA (MazF antagonist)